MSVEAAFAAVKAGSVSRLESALLAVSRAGDVKADTAAKRDTAALAEKLLHAAVASRQWATAEYLAAFLRESEYPTGGEEVVIAEVKVGGDDADASEDFANEAFAADGAVTNMAPAQSEDLRQVSWDAWRADDYAM